MKTTSNLLSVSRRPVPYGPLPVDPEFFRYDNALITAHYRGLEDLEREIGRKGDFKRSLWKAGKAALLVSLTILALYTAMKVSPTPSGIAKNHRLENGYVTKSDRYQQPVPAPYLHEKIVK